MHKIELSADHLNVVGAALAELPFKIAQPVINAIQKQLEAEAKPVAEENGGEAAA